jgi:DNA polymerase III epsilon subunit-like protein
MSKRGEFDIVFAVDCETSGLNYKGSNISTNYQAISFGIIATSIKNFKPIDKLYVEIQFDSSKYRWDKKAEDIHGLSRDYLKENGMSEEEAANQIGTFIYEYLGDINKPVILLGHNVATFDWHFLKKLLHNNGLPFRLSYRCLDTFALSMATVQEFNSDDLFSSFGIEQRKEHNALEDASHALTVYRKINKIWKSIFK